MKALSKLRGLAALCTLACSAGLVAQQEPVVAVDITDITIYHGMEIEMISRGSGYVSPPEVMIFGGGGIGARAEATVSGGEVTAITVTNDGAGYTRNPDVYIAAPGAFGGSATATVNAAGEVTGFTVTNRGSGYTTEPAVTLSGGGGTGAEAAVDIDSATGQIVRVRLTNAGSGYATAPSVMIALPTGGAATARAILKVESSGRNPNEFHGPYGVPINITALGRGTFTKDSFTYEFFVNGTPIGRTPEPILPPTPAIAPWTPPQPGAYLLTVTITDGMNKATSLAVRYFATGTSIIGPVDNTIVPNGSSVVIQATAVPPPVGPTAFVQRMEFWIDGTLRGTDYNYPYSLIYTPEANGGDHLIEAKAYDNNGALVSPIDDRTVRMVTAVGTPPTVSLLDPLNGTSVSAGSTVSLLADAVSQTGYIKNVDFYVNGVKLASSQRFPFKSSWESQVPGRYEFVAIASDDKSNAVASAPITINVTGGFPTATITSPPAEGVTITQGAKMSVAVSAAGADGGITSLKKLELLVDGMVTESLPKNPDNLPVPPPLTEPFVFTWKSSVSTGLHKMAARVTDANGLTRTSAEVPILVVPNEPPTITLTSPEDGASVSVNTAVTITATAGDSDGSVEAVEFFVNGSSLGAAVTRSPYQWTWTPTAVGPYTITAKVTDNADASVTSAPVSVTVTPASSGSGGGSNSVYRGDYASTTETGKFAFGIGRTGRGTFIAYSGNPAGQTYYWTDIAISPEGRFTAGPLSGEMSSTGVSGTFGDKTFIGPITTGSTTPLMLNGGVNGTADSSVVALVGADGIITLYSAAGGKADAGSGTVGSSGAYVVATPMGSRYSGTLSSSTSTISGTISGATPGTFVLKLAPSRLVNLSARSIAGSGERTLIAGFMVSGTAAKPLLVRAVGPTLALLGVGSPLPNPSLRVVSSSNAELGSNEDWSGTALTEAFQRVGAFDLPAGSKDAALQLSIAPSASGMTASTAVVGGASTPGGALVEIYDADTAVQPASRLSNLSARSVLTSDDVLIAGFVIKGDQRKKLLIRAVGPALSRLGIASPFADPKLEVLMKGAPIAGNNDWSSAGATQISTVTNALGAFPLDVGSKDAALLTYFGPGEYTVHVTGTTTGSGIVLLEIYDVDP